MSIPGNFIYFLWWRATTPFTLLKGSIRSGDADIHYRSYGEGPAVLLLHGGLSHRLSWFSQVPWLVAGGRQVIMLDTRGHGASGLGEHDLSYHLLASDAVQVLQQLRIPRTDVIGWSDGANTALLLSHAWPELVDKIVAISGNSDPTGLTSAAQEENYQQSRGPRYWLKRWWTGTGKHFTELEKRINLLWRTGPRLTPADLRTMKAPTLLIIGEHDLITPEHARQLADLIPRGSLAMIPAGGHATLISHAVQVNSLIGKFLCIPYSTTTHT
jgi:pimeloyl-ACP methyl ester carboxylesterase